VGFIRDYPQWDVELNICEQIEDAIKDVDIINVATRAKKGLFKVTQIKSDVHINAVGAYQRSMKEISNEVIENSSMVVVDDLVGSRHEAGDLIQAHNALDCAWTWDDISGDLQALVTGKSTNSEPAMTLFKSVGAASFDAAVALYVAQKAQNNNIGLSIA
jgi:ornithine cyclodeaminase/alanine dehydrogenase-like protein (mu-crystallin family)